MKKGNDVFEGCTSLESFFVNGKFINTGRKIVKEKRKTQNVQKKKTETVIEIKENLVSRTQNKIKNKTQTEDQYHRYIPENKESMHKDMDKAVKKAEQQKQQVKQKENKGLKVMAEHKRLEKYESVKKFFTYTPKTLFEILNENHEELKELGIMSPLALLFAIKPGLESYEIIKEMDGKITTYRL